MKKLDIIVFTASLALFSGVALLPQSRLDAQMANWCPGGSTLLCGTEQRQTCLRVDPRTAQCAEWKTETLYYYYAADGSGGGPCGGPGGTCVE